MRTVTASPTTPKKEGWNLSEASQRGKVSSSLSISREGRCGPLRDLPEMEGREIGAAIMTVVLVAVGVIVANVIMRRFSDLLALVDAPEKGTNGA
jgi:hypothetical protein